MTIANNYPTVAPSLELNFAQTKVLDPRITFTRASTATYYDATTSVVAEQNLLLNSNNYINTITSTGLLSVTGGQTDPLGGSTAVLVIPSTSSVVHASYPGSAITTTASVPYTVSIYVKANGYNYVGLSIHNGATTAGNETIQVFNLSTGAVATSYNTAPTSATITNIGSGWYRISITWTISTSTLNITFWPMASDVNPRTTFFAGDGTSGIYFWGAQLEQRSAVTAYNVTTSTTITNYIPVLQTAANNVARFDHNPTTRESLGLLIEESRTNLLTYSSAFNNPAWSLGAGGTGAVTADQNIAPDGTQSADFLYDLNTTTNYRLLEQTASLTTATNYSMSCFVKAAGNGFAYLRIGQAFTGNNIIVYFNLSTGAVGTSTRFANANSPTIVSTSSTLAGNSWYRIVVVFTANVTSSHYCQIGMSTSDNVFSYTGNGFNGIYIWGAQLEAGSNSTYSYVTSYIPTVASQVTRASDLAVITGTNFSSWYNISQGALYSKWNSFGNLSNTYPIPVSITDGSLNNRFQLGTNGGNSYGYRSYINMAGVQTYGGNFGSALSTNNISAITWSSTSVLGGLNGASGGSGTFVGLPTVNKLEIGSLIGSSFLNGWLNKLAFYPITLTATQLQALTGS